MEKKRLIPSSNNLHSKGILNTKLHHQHPLQYLNMLFTHQSSVETLLGIFLVVQLVKNPTAMQETWVWSLGWEDPLEEDKATHSSILAWRISWTEDPGGLQSLGPQRVRHNYWETEHTLHVFLRWSNYISCLKIYSIFVKITTYHIFNAQ